MILVLTTRRSSKDCLISYGGNRYLVAASYAQRTLQVRETEGDQVLIFSNHGQQVAQHRLLLGTDQQSIQVQH